MGSLKVRCASCATLLKVQADNAGLRLRCKQCGAVITIPGVPSEGDGQVRPRRAEGAVNSEQPLESTGDDRDAVAEPERVPGGRRKRPRRRRNLDHVTDLQSAPGWRKVRLGLILIALSMCLIFWWHFLGSIFALRWAPLDYLLQSLPIAGFLLCVFVPLKGVARNLVVANLVVIALGLALLIVAHWIVTRDLTSLTTNAEELTRKSQELTKQLTADLKADDKEEQELRQRLADLRKKAAAGDKKADNEQAEVSKKVAELHKKAADLRQKRLAENIEAMKQASADFEAAASRPRWGGRFWVWIEAHGLFVSLNIRIIFLAFFLQAVALALGDRDLAASNPRVAWLALVTLGLVLIDGLLPGAWFIHRPLWWVMYLLGLISIIWQGIMLIEACKIIGNHLKPHST
jgi:hypothetical protein